MIVVGSTLAQYKCDGSELNWLLSGEEMVEDARAYGAEVSFFAALEVNSRQYDLDPYRGIRKRFAELAIAGAKRTFTWIFAIDDGSSSIDSNNRLIRICTGRNLITEYALRQKECTHVLFLDSDLAVPGDCISKLLEVEQPDGGIVGGDVPSYCLSGPEIEPGIQMHWNTAGFLLVPRGVLGQVRWGWDPDQGITDDPWYQLRASNEGYGETLVRKDVRGAHVPLIPVEQRGHDLSL